MRRYRPHFLLLLAACAVVGYGAGFASKRFGVSAAGLVSMFGAAVLLVEKRARTRKARAGVWSTLAAGSVAIAVAVLPGGGRFLFVAPVLAGAVFIASSRSRRRPRKPRLGPPGRVKRLSQPSSGDG
jgi:peptidoglycan/LPS O-acetylase OafA/YrhL